METSIACTSDQYSSELKHIHLLIEDGGRLGAYFNSFEKVLNYRGLLPPIPKKYQTLRDGYNLKNQNTYSKKSDEWTAILLKTYEENIHAMITEEEDEITLK